MSGSIAREVRKLMEEAGFVLVRSNRHNVWKRGEVMITTSITPSDYRALKNIKKQIKQANEGRQIT